MTEKERQWLKANNITFAAFKMVINALIYGDIPISEDSLVSLYEDFAEGVIKYNFNSIEEWAEDFLQDWTIDEQNHELRSKFWKLQPEKKKPPFNVAVLLKTKGDEDFILGMWDISEKWTELPSYETPLYPVIGWYSLPQLQ